MNKNLVALAVTAALAAPMAAQAGVEVYGKARLSFGSITNDDKTAGADSSKLAISSHASRIGFKGAEDLDNGMKAIWQIERSVDFTDQSSTLGVRNTFAGLAGDFGTVLLGTHDTPYKISTGSLDPFGDTFGDYNAVIDSNNDVRSKNVLAYISPSMSGFSVIGAYVTDFVDDNLKDSTLNQKSPAFSVAGIYSNGPLYATLAYQHVAEISSIVGDTCTATDKCGDSTAAKLGLGYKIAQFSLGLVYESTKVGTTNSGAYAGDSIKQNNYHLSAVMDAGSGIKVKAAYGKKDDVDIGGNQKDSGATFYALGVGKSMSANTELYALYANITDGKNAMVGAKSSGNLGVGNQIIGAAGKAGGDMKASALVVGINHNFSSM